jgi:hypothetical protein
MIEEVPGCGSPPAQEERAIETIRIPEEQVHREVEACPLVVLVQVLIGDLRLTPGGEGRPDGTYPRGDAA